MKIQSGIENDIAHLKRDSFIFQNCVDAQTLFALTQPKDAACGIEAATRYTWKPKFGEKKMREPWVPKFNKDYVDKHLQKASLRHSIQDVLVSFALVLKVTLDLASIRGYDVRQISFHP